MNFQTTLTLEDTAASSDLIRARNRAADDKAERIRGIELCIAQYSDALRLNTYPLIGRGEPLSDEHRPYLETHLANWKRELAELISSLDS